MKFYFVCKCDVNQCVLCNELVILSMHYLSTRTNPETLIRFPSSESEVNPSSCSDLIKFYERVLFHSQSTDPFSFNNSLPKREEVRMTYSKTILLLR